MSDKRGMLTSGCISVFTDLKFSSFFSGRLKIFGNEDKVVTVTGTTLFSCLQQDSHLL